LVSTGRDLTELVAPPRSLFVNFPMGNSFGPPNEPDTQRAILTAALRLAEQATAPGAIVDHDARWRDDFSAQVRDRLLSTT